MNSNGHSKSGSSTLRIGLLGCGRMGQRHANNIVKLASKAQLVAVADPSPVAKAWVKENAPGATYYNDPEELFGHNGLDAVIISTITSTHAPLTIKAIDRNLHVLLEKPISIDVEDSRPVVEKANSRPDLKVMIGFVRRFDQHFTELYSHIESSVAGRPYLLKSTTQDPYDTTGFFVQYAKASGGIFMDCGIHDIDMSRWILGIGGPKASPRQVKKVFATGLTARHPELAAQDDCDNALAIIDYHNGSSCTLHLSRTGMGGYESLVEVYGLEQKLQVGTPASSIVQITDGAGRRVESAPSYMDRFGHAFVRELQTFIDCCLDDKPVPATANDALQAAQIAKALTHSYLKGVPVAFNDDGEPVL